MHRKTALIIFLANFAILIFPNHNFHKKHLVRKTSPNSPLQTYFPFLKILSKQLCTNTIIYPDVSLQLLLTYIIAFRVFISSTWKQSFGKIFLFKYFFEPHYTITRVLWRAAYFVIYNNPFCSIFNTKTLLTGPQ